MTFNIHWPAETVTATIDEIRDNIGREVEVYVKVAGEACPTCTLDVTTNLSADPFCPTCSGTYWINTLSGWSVNAHVRWRSTDQPKYTPGGIIDEGDCHVTIKYTEAALSNIQNSDHFIVDSRDMYMKNYKLRGAPEPNRITVTLLEDND
jgi:hypothetical protein